MKSKKHYLIIVIILFVIVFFMINLFKSCEGPFGNGNSKDEIIQIYTNQQNEFQEIVEMMNRKDINSLLIRRQVFGINIESGDDNFSLSEKLKLSSLLKNNDFITIYVDIFDGIKYMEIVDENSWLDMQTGLIYIFNENGNEEFLSHLLGKNYLYINQGWYYFSME